jgi:hypothetical protein
MRLLLSAVLALLAIAVGCTSPSDTQPGDLRAFTTDGCSGFPEGPPGHPNLWCDCCVAHDFAYWKGGTAAQRKVADAKLRACVTERYKALTGTLMELGVRAGGTPYLPTSYRWGYGWPFGRGYAPVTPEEEPVVEERGRNCEQARMDRCGSG